jgi:hypothetical protein
MRALTKLRVFEASFVFLLLVGAGQAFIEHSNVGVVSYLATIAWFESWRVREFLSRRRGAPVFALPQPLIEARATAALKTMRRRFFVLFVAWLVLRLAGEVWARHGLEVYSRATALECEAERRELAESRRPVVAAKARDEDAAPEYERLFERIGPGDEALRKMVADAAHDAPGADFDQARAVMRDKTEELGLLRNATACTRCVWVVDHAADPREYTDRGMRAMKLGTLLEFSAHELARTGRLEDAAAAYMDALRFACDLSRRDLLCWLAGASFGYGVARELGALVVAVPRSRIASFAFVRDGLTKLEPEWPTTRRAFRSERLSQLGFVRVTNGTPFGSTLTLSNVLIPERALYAHGLEVNADYLRRLEAAADEKRAAREAIEASIDAEARASWNPIVSGLMRDVCRLSTLGLALEARFRLTKTALALALGDAPEIPPDPLSPSGEPLRLKQSDRGFKLWSVGQNGVDDGGIPGEGSTGDLVLERRE